LGLAELPIAGGAASLPRTPRSVARSASGGRPTGLPGRLRVAGALRAREPGPPSTVPLVACPADSSQKGRALAASTAPPIPTADPSSSTGTLVRPPARAPSQRTALPAVQRTDRPVTGHCELRRPPRLCAERLRWSARPCGTHARRRPSAGGAHPHRGRGVASARVLGGLGANRPRCSWRCQLFLDKTLARPAILRRSAPERRTGTIGRSVFQLPLTISQAIYPKCESQGANSSASDNGLTLAMDSAIPPGLICRPRDAVPGPPPPPAAPEGEVQKESCIAAEPPAVAPDAGAGPGPSTRFLPSLVQAKEHEAVSRVFWKDLEGLDAIMRARGRIVVADGRFTCKICNAEFPTSVKLLQHCWGLHKAFLK